jgi:cysteine-rich repeat protein
VGKIEPPQAEHERVEGIHVTNQFGEQQLRSLEEVELCLRSDANPGCGDGREQPVTGEECDDGNTDDGDGCSSTCHLEFCGDGIAQPGIGEQCDGGDDSMCPEGCQSDCRCPHGACVGTTEIPPEGGTFFGTTSGSDTESAPCVADTGPEKVFAWTPARSGVATIDTCGSSYDTVLYVREAICEDTSRDIACNDDFCGVGSSVFPEVQAGTTYFIFVDGFGASSGSFTLGVRPPPIYGSPTRAFLSEVPGLLE